MGLSFKPESDDVRDAPSVKIIRQLSLLGYTHLCGYDPVANAEFRKYYPDLQIAYYDGYDEIVREADAFVIATAWEEFKDIHTRTDKQVIDCRYFL